MEIKQILNAFQPAQAIADYRKFVGRSSELEKATVCLLSQGAHLFVYGPRGIGKTSFACMVTDIARGKSRGLADAELPDLARERCDFLPFYITCDDTVMDIDSLIHRIITSPDGLAPHVGHDEVAKTIETVRKMGVAPQNIGVQSERREITQTRTLQMTTVDTFIHLLDVVTRKCKNTDGVFIVVDEFDRVENREGLASLLKALSHKPVKFMIVGVARDLKDLIRDHESLKRQVAEGTIRIQRMSLQEAADIITRVEKLLKHRYVFGAIKTEIARLSQGEPYLVHLFGKYALREAHRNKMSSVHHAQLQRAIHTIVTDIGQNELEERYRKAVASSEPRERVLRAFAAIADDQIHNSQAYALCRCVSQPAVYLGHLRQKRYGEELVDLGGRYHQFRDELFKAYVNATPSRFYKDGSNPSAPYPHP